MSVVSLSNSVLGFLAGKKTYAIGILLILLGLLQKNPEVVLEGLGLLFLRAGVSKIGS